MSAYAGSTVAPHTATGMWNAPTSTARSSTTDIAVYAAAATPTRIPRAGHRRTTSSTASSRPRATDLKMPIDTIGLPLLSTSGAVPANGISHTITPRQSTPPNPPRAVATVWSTGLCDIL